jgi:hypothetical protein
MSCLDPLAGGTRRRQEKAKRENPRKAKERKAKTEMEKEKVPKGGVEIALHRGIGAVVRHEKEAGPNRHLLMLEKEARKRFASVIFKESANLAMPIVPESTTRRADISNKVFANMVKHVYFHTTRRQRSHKAPRPTNERRVLAPRDEPTVRGKHNGDDPNQDEAELPPHAGGPRQPSVFVVKSSRV